MDTFARNEGDSGGKAHFKFVFTLDDSTSLSGESQDGSVASTSALSLLSFSSTSTRIATGESCIDFSNMTKVDGLVACVNISQHVCKDVRYFLGVVYLEIGDVLVRSPPYFNDYETSTT